MSGGGAGLLELLRIARLGGSPRTSRLVTLSIFSETRASLRSEATTYVGGSNKLIVDSQDQFTSGHVLLGNRPRPANAK
jgi:hypothetical protein